MKYSFHPEAGIEFNISVDYYEKCQNNLTNRFPFGIIYYQQDDEIIILAVMQLNKKPNYWVDRTKK